jgi:hypothetical protein
MTFTLIVDKANQYITGAIKKMKLLDLGKNKLLKKVDNRITILVTTNTTTDEKSNLS